MKRSYPIEVIVVAHDAAEADAMTVGMREAGMQLKARLASRAGALADALGKRLCDLVLVKLHSDLPPPDRVMALVAEHGREAAVIGVASSAESAHAAMSRGFHDVVRPDDAHGLARKVAREVGRVRQHRALVAARRALSDSSRTILELMDSHPDPCALVVQGVILHGNPAFRACFGFDPDAEIRGVPLAECVAEPERADLGEALAELSPEEPRSVVLELQCRHRADGDFPAKLELTPTIVDGKHGHRIRVRTAAAEVQAAPATPAAAAPAKPAADPDTGMWPREALFEAMQGFDAATPGALVYLEIENHRDVRDEVGFIGMESVMTEAARRLHARLPKGGMAARVADDAFAVLLRGVDHPPPPDLGAPLAAAVGGKSYDVEGRSVTVACRFGISQPGGKSPPDAIGQAFADARRERVPGAAPAEVAEPEVQAAGDDAAVEEALQSAIEEQRLSIVYQPIVRLHGEPVELYEAFIRLKDRDGQSIPAGKFFPVAERTGLIGKLDLWVVETVCGVLAERHALGRDTQLFVKLSKHAMHEMEIPLALGRGLRAGQVPPERLIVEIDEAAAVTHMKTARAFLSSLKNIGCRTALEHFGVGLSSFRLLDQLSVDFLKIDSTLISGLVSDDATRKKVREIAERAVEAGCHTIAERLEDARALAMLFQTGIEFAQGYYIQEPTPTLEFEFDIELG